MGPVGNVHFRNNLILGQGAAEAVFGMETFTAYSSSDYNGIRLNNGAATGFTWTAPASGSTVDYSNTLEKRSFATLGEYARATGQDQHSVLVDYSDFEQAPQLDKSNPGLLHDPAKVDFRLKPGSAAVNAGVELPNINAGYTGSAPDLGAYELGQPATQYGPRSGRAYLDARVTKPRE